VLWIGNEANQRALANKIHAAFPVAGIVTETRKTKTQITFSKLLEKVVEKIFLSKIGKSWRGMQQHYHNRFPNYPSTKILDVENINSTEAFEFTKSLSPDLIIVSGTRLIKNKMLSLKPGMGILNLHTGLSPYIKGGPNCTNWCIATSQFHFIGNTIMWIDAGIDTGNIVTTEFTHFSGNEDLAEVHLKVMEHAHALYLKALGHINNGSRSSIPQSTLAEGITYYSKQWTLRQKRNLVGNFKKFKAAFQSGEVNKKRETVREIKL
jgi:methionyl-tRNA formyltransferase